VELTFLINRFVSKAATAYIVLCGTFLVSLVCAEAQANSLTNGVLGYWTFNGTAVDASGNGNGLSLSGGASYGPGQYGQALSLDGALGSSAVQPVNNTAFDLGAGDFTIQVWANANDLSGSPVLVEKFSGQSGPGWTFYLSPNASGIQFYSNGTLLLSPSAAIPTHAWQDYIVERQGSVLSMFFDGSLVATGSISGSLSASSNPLLIGARDAGDGRNFTFSGLIDNVGIWNRALSNAEIGALWNNGAGVQLSFAVPEPTTLWLLCTGLMGLVIVRCRRPG
jgi:hypothetical protein